MEIQRLAHYVSGLAGSSLAPIAGLRNVLIHQYVRIDWDEIYRNLQQIDDLSHFAQTICGWLRCSRDEGV